MEDSPGFFHRSQLNFGFITVILLTLGVDIALVYLIYRTAHIFW